MQANSLQKKGHTARNSLREDLFSEIDVMIGVDQLDSNADRARGSATTSQRRVAMTQIKHSMQEQQPTAEAGQFEKEYD